MWVEFDNNPVRENADDCAIRAISKALNIDWERAYILLCVNGMAMGVLMNRNEVIFSVLRQNGFKRKNIPDTCPACFTIEEFCERYPQGTYVVGTGNHVVTIIDGDYYDSWRSGDEIVAFAWEKERRY